MKHVLIESDETSDPDYLANTPNRCFFCKKETYGKLNTYAEQHGFQTIVDGTNADDIGDYRPGRQAAREYNVRSPLLEAASARPRSANWRRNWACRIGTNRLRPVSLRGFHTVQPSPLKHFRRWKAPKPSCMDWACTKCVYVTTVKLPALKLTRRFPTFAGTSR